MAKKIPEEELREIEAVVAAQPAGMGIQEIASALSSAPPRRTLQYRLRSLVEQQRLLVEGERRWVIYKTANTLAGAETSEVVPFSKSALEVLAYVRKPLALRKPVGYNRRFLDQYKPNVSAYLNVDELTHLKAVGELSPSGVPAGTYAKQLLSRLLIDLSWNSSRLEGNTYSLLDTKRLLDFGEEAEGKQQLDAQMILNHKDAIEFLFGQAEVVGFNRHTLLNLHALLANNLLADVDATGRLRHIAVGIEKSVFHPLEVPQLIDECFNQILATAAAIKEPFEQAFFVMVHLPYLQPFDDVNKRVSRLAANIPLVKANLAPLSFTDVATTTYTEAILGVYELTRVELLKDVFIWAYERSAQRYAAVRQSLGEPDSFRLTYRNELRKLVKEVVHGKLNRKSAYAYVGAWATKHIKEEERDKFREVAESELLGLHEGNFARYQLKPSEFDVWQLVWADASGGKI